MFFILFFKIFVIELLQIGNDSLESDTHHSPQTRESAVSVYGLEDSRTPLKFWFT